MQEGKKGFILNNILDNVLKNNKKSSKFNINELKKYDGLLPKGQLDKLTNKETLSNQTFDLNSSQSIFNKQGYLVRKNLITEADMNNEKKQND